jgi:antitoxin component YwqK of YwqJK toxin-antitoxin module
MGIFDFLKPQDMKDKLDGLSKTLNGYSETYYESGGLRVERNYSNGKLHGSFKNFNEDGTLRGEGNFFKGKLEGLFKFESKVIGNDELLKFEINFKNGKEHGTCKEFYSDGKLKTECYYENGNQKYLKSKLYSKDGKVYSPNSDDMHNFLFYYTIGMSKVLNEVDLKRKLKYR